MKYSVVIAARNEAKNIADCMNSAKGASEFVLIDNDSTDDTVQIASKLGAQVFHRKLDGFATQKNFGIDQTTNDWVLILDGDERLTAALADEILALEPGKTVGYRMAFRNYLGHKWLKHGGLYPDYHIRLFDKRVARYGQRQIHEQLEYQGEIETLEHDMIHWTYRNASEYLAKVKRYAPLEAGWDQTKPSILAIAKTFYRKYIKEQGIRDGIAGLISAAMLTYYQVLKRRAAKP